MATSRDSWDSNWMDGGSGYAYLEQDEAANDAFNAALEPLPTWDSAEERGHEHEDYGRNPVDRTVLGDDSDRTDGTTVWEYNRYEYVGLTIFSIVDWCRYYLLL